MKFSFASLGCLAVLFSAAIALSPFTAGLEVGDTAPDFELKNTDGSMVSLESTAKAYAEKGIPVKGYIVTFTCNTCPYAQMYEDRLQALHAEMAPQGWPVVAIQPNDTEITPDDDLPAMKKRAKEKGFTFDYLLDKEQEVFPVYGASRTPHVFLLDKTRKVHYIGAIDDNPRNPDAVSERFVVNAIKAVEANQKPDPDFTKAIGCTIKVKQ
ncbi:MAG TPA: thioredoxin family protein [Saprospiraceae bacterium]|nr:thioredoxin family protein [Saprospiraceae bacterium]